MGQLKSLNSVHILCIVKCENVNGACVYIFLHWDKILET